MTTRKAILLMLASLVVIGSGSPAVGSAAVNETVGAGWALYPSNLPTNFGPGVDEVQEITANAPTELFTITFEEQQSGPISGAASASEVQAALEAMPTIGPGNVQVTSSAAEKFKVQFVGTLSGTKVAELEASGASVSVTTEGAASGTIVVGVFNVGAAGSSGGATIIDRLPAGFTAKEAGTLVDPGQYEEKIGIDPIISHNGWECTGNGPGSAPKVYGATVLTCTTQNGFAGGASGTPQTGDHGNHPQPEIGITVASQPGIEEHTDTGANANHVTISGGGAKEPFSASEAVTFGTALPPTGLAQASSWFSNADGTIDQQAGSHPYAVSFAFDPAVALNSQQNAYFPGGEIRNLETRVPAGFVGDLHEVPQCTRKQLAATECPPASMVGRLAVKTLSLSFVEQVFNMVPPPGAPAEIGFDYGEVPVYVSFNIQSGSNNAVVAKVTDIPQRLSYENVLTLWDEPQDASHNIWRYGEGGCGEGSEPLEEYGPPYSGESINYCHVVPGAALVPTLRLPTQCEEVGAVTFRETAAWEDPTAKSEISTPILDANGNPSRFNGCELLGAESSIAISAESAAGDTPTGLTADVKPSLGGLEQRGGLGSADLRDATVSLPAGTVINPGQANGLQTCPEGKPSSTNFGDALTTPAETAAGEEDTEDANCPPAAKVGTVIIKSPLIEGATEKEFEGNVYVLPSNPPEIKLLIAATADGINLKLVGTASLCQASGEQLDGKSCEAAGQVIAAFKDTPQLPFRDFKLSFAGGTKAALDTPARCGTYPANADFAPWSSPFVADFITDASFGINAGANGTACPNGTLPFAPTMAAGTTNTEAGGFTPFVAHLTRADGQQRVDTISFTAPEGISAIIAGVPECGETEANAGTCPAASKLGHAIVQAGPGNSPLTLPQPGEPEIPIYLTGPYHGAPFGMSIVTPVIAGPFNLGNVVTRARIEVNPSTAQVTVTTDPLPQIVKGVPTDIRSIEAIINRPNFLFNPTNCTPQTATGTAQGTAPMGAPAEPGQTAGLSSQFDVGGCRGLEFKPKLSVSTPAKTSKALGAGLTAKLTYPTAAKGTEANIKSVKVDLPKQLPSQLKTLQKACTNAQFELNPANCPKESKVGYAKVITPVLPVPLEGPAIFVSHGGEAFPSLTMVLQGDNVTIDLVGTTHISHAGITSTTFKTVPDVPFSTFTLTLAQGKYSALTANLPAKAKHSFCGQKLTMPTAFVAQNGAEIHESTPISVSGCKKAKKAIKKKKGKSKHASRGKKK